MKTVVTVAVALLATAFSGCILLPEESFAGSLSIVRKIVVDVDPDADEPDRIEDVVKTTLEYRHGGASVASSAVTIEFLDATGRDRMESLARHDADGTVEAGETIIIRDANITSGLVVRQGSNVLAERQGLRADWLDVQKVPLPVTFAKGGTAKYAVEAEGQFRFHALDFRVGEGEDSTRFESAEFDLHAELDGSIEAKSTLPAVGPRLAISSHFHAKGGAETDLIRFEDGRRMQDGGRATMESFNNGSVKLQFNTDGSLIRVGFDGDSWADGDVVTWNEDHPKSENWHSEDIQHPFFDETQEYEEEEIDPLDSDIPPEWVAFLNRLWGTTLGVGDEVRFHTGYQEEGSGFDFDYVAQVLGKDRREVMAGTFDTFRISQRMSFETRGRAGEHEFDIIQQTTWVDQKSHLPVFEQTKYTKSFDRDDINQILRTLGEDAPATLPEEVSVVLQGESTTQLAELTNDILVAPILTFGGMATGGAAAAAAAMFVLISDIGGSDYYGEDFQMAPTLSWSMDESADRMTVAAASSDAAWERLTIQVVGCTQRANGAAVGRVGSATGTFNHAATVTGEALNDAEPSGTRCGYATPVAMVQSYEHTGVSAGDFVEFCSSPPLADMTEVTVETRDTYTNSIIAQHTFTTWADC